MHVVNIHAEQILAEQILAMRTNTTRTHTYNDTRIPVTAITTTTTHAHKPTHSITSILTPTPHTSVHIPIFTNKGQKNYPNTHAHTQEAL